MTPVTVLLVLLVVSYIGGHWAEAPGKRAFGSASGLEYVVLGIVLGPQGLASLDEHVLLTFEPVSLVALGWIALGYGVEVGAVGDQGVRRGPVMCGLFMTCLVAAATALCVHSVAVGLAPAERILLSACVGLVCAQSARDAVFWMADRHGAEGPLHSWLLDFSRADDAPVLLSLPFVFAAFHPPQLVYNVAFGPALMAGCSLTLGAFLGLAAAGLMHMSSSRVERWTILLGSGLLATGISESIGLSAMGTCFALGATMSVRVKDTEQVREKLAATEGTVLLPALLLAGAHLAPPTGPDEWRVLLAAMAARVAVTVLAGSVLGIVTQKLAPVRGNFGLGLLSSGTLSIIVGFALYLRFGGEIGRITLSAAFFGTLLGELIGAPALRRTLSAAGDIGSKRAPTPQAPLAPSEPV